jgi:hypothetical protein
MRSFALFAIGFAAIPCAVAVAAVLESLADRKAVAAMPDDERQERERRKVADAVSRGLLPGSGNFASGSPLSLIPGEEQQPPRRKREEPKSAVAALWAILASILGPR